MLHCSHDSRPGCFGGSSHRSAVPSALQVQFWLLTTCCQFWQLDYQFSMRFSPVSCPIPQSAVRPISKRGSFWRYDFWIIWAFHVETSMRARLILLLAHWRIDSVERFLSFALQSITIKTPIYFALHSFFWFFYHFSIAMKFNRSIHIMRAFACLRIWATTCVAFFSRFFSPQIWEASIFSSGLALT